MKNNTATNENQQLQQMNEFNNLQVNTNLITYKLRQAWLLVWQAVICSEIIEVGVAEIKSSKLKCLTG